MFCTPQKPCLKTSIYLSTNAEVFTLSPIIMEVEHGCIWKVTTIGGTHFSLPLWEEVYHSMLNFLFWKTIVVDYINRWKIFGELRIKASKGNCLNLPGHPGKKKPIRQAHENMREILCESCSIMFLFFIFRVSFILGLWLLGIPR